MVTQLCQNTKQVDNLRAQIVAIDFLRFKGYALPWMGISVEEQVQRGWINLREPQTDK